MTTFFCILSLAVMAGLGIVNLFFPSVTISEIENELK